MVHTPRRSHIHGHTAVMCGCVCPEYVQPHAIERDAAPSPPDPPPPPLRSSVLSKWIDSPHRVTRPVRRVNRARAPACAGVLLLCQRFMQSLVVLWLIEISSGRRRTPCELRRLLADSAESYRIPVFLWQCIVFAESEGSTLLNYTEIHLADQ